MKDPSYFIPVQHYGHDAGTYNFTDDELANVQCCIDDLPRADDIGLDDAKNPTCYLHYWNRATDTDYWIFGDDEFVHGPGYCALICERGGRLHKDYFMLDRELDNPSLELCPNFKPATAAEILRSLHDRGQTFIAFPSAEARPTLAELYNQLAS